MDVRQFIAVLVVVTFTGISGSAAGRPAQAALPEPPRIESEILPNGIRVSRVFRNDPGDEIEIAFGYRTPIRPGVSFERGETANLVHRYLELSVPARTVALAAHYAGGTFEPIDDAGRVGMRVRVPRANAEGVVRRIARYFAHSIIHYEVLDYARDEVAEGSPHPEFANVETNVLNDEKLAEAESLLLGANGQPESENPDATDLGSAQNYIDRYLGTDRAWVVVSGAEPAIDSNLLASVSFRPANLPADANEPLAAERVDLEFPSEPEGGMILATLVPSPHYQSWFGAVVIDEVLRASAPPQMQFAFPLGAEESVHLVRIPVHIPDYAEDFRDNWFDSLVRMIYTPLPDDEIAAAKQKALSRLGDRSMIEWFAAYGLASAFRNGWEAISQLGPDELRVFASSFYSFRRVAATWAPSFSQPVAVVEDLSVARAEEPAPITQALRPVPGGLPALGPIDDAVPAIDPLGLARLESGITLAPSNRSMVLVAGAFSDELPGGVRETSNENGALWSFPGGMPPDIETLLSGVRAQRLLFFVPAPQIAIARSRFSTWTGGSADTVPVPLIGEFATVDIPSVLVLKMWLEARLIEAGWWADARVAIEGLEGSRLVVEADPEREAVIREWIREASAGEIPASEFAQAHRAAMEHFSRLRTDLQIILWQRAPDGTIPPPTDVTPQLVQGVAQRYF